MQLADLLIPCHPSEAINSSWDTELGERKKKKKRKKTKTKPKKPKPNETRKENPKPKKNTTFDKKGCDKNSLSTTLTHSGSVLNREL